MIQNSQLAQVKDQHEITRQPPIQVKITCRPNETNFLEVAFHGGLFFWVNNCHSYENVSKKKKSLALFTTTTAVEENGP